MQANSQISISEFENPLIEKYQQSNENSQYSPAQIIDKKPLDTIDGLKLSSNTEELTKTFNLFVGKIQDGVVTLLSDDFNLVEIPLNILPNDLRKGNILRITIERNIFEEERRRNDIVGLQKLLLDDENLFLKEGGSII